MDQSRLSVWTSESGFGVGNVSKHQTGASLSKVLSSNLELIKFPKAFQHLKISGLLYFALNIMYFTSFLFHEYNEF